VGELLARNSALRLGPIAGQQPSLSVFQPLANVGGLGALDRVLAADVGVLDRLREQLVAPYPPRRSCSGGRWEHGGSTGTVEARGHAGRAGER
jgi:hypothetical protein